MEKAIVVNTNRIGVIYRNCIWVTFVIGVFQISFAQGLPKKYAESITEDELKEMLYEYASDDFQGRETGKEGQKKAVAFIEAFYKDIGIRGGLSHGKYRQKTPLKINKPVEGKFKVGEKTFSIGKDVFVLNSDIKNFDEKGFVYVGFGIEDASYSDYEDLDIRGKVVFAKKGEPKENKGRYLVSKTTSPSDWSASEKTMMRRYEMAKKRQAKAFILYDEDAFKRAKNYYKVMKDNSRMVLDEYSKSGSMPLIIVSKKVALELYPEFEKKFWVKRLSTRVSAAFIQKTEKISSENVVAYIQGSEFPNEYIVLSAHLDHLGTDPNGNVFNGADDDGSGTVALLEIAEAFSEAEEEGYAPKRSIVFLSVTGEEKGLLGSKYYTRHPVFPLKKTVTNLNIDMIGRIDPKRLGDRNYLYLIGSDKLSQELHNLSEEVNEKCCGLELDYTFNDDNDPNKFYYRSDHYNFAKNNIPIIFYFNGVHEDYHRITDTPDKINYDLLTNRARLVFYTAWEIANRPKRIKVDKK